MAQVGWGRQLGLAVVLVTLGTVAYYVEYTRKPKKEAEEEQAKKIFALKDVHVESIRVVDGVKIYEFKCADLEQKLCKPGDNSKWELTAPLKAKADASNVNSLLSSLNNLSISEKVDLKDETEEKRKQLLKEYKLDADSRKQADFRRVEVKPQDADAIVAYFGETHPVGDNIFTLVETGGKASEDSVYLVPSYFKSNLSRELTHWRDKKLLTLATNEVKGFEYKGPKAEVSGERKDGLWVLKTKNEELPGDIEGVDNFISAATFLNAKDFISDNKSSADAKKTLQGAKPHATITLRKEKGTNDKEAPAPITLSLYEKAGKEKEAKKAYATVSNLDPLFELDSSALNRVNKELKDFRLSKLVTSMEKFSAKKLEFSGEPLGGSLVLDQLDGKWILAGNDQTELDSEKVQKLLDKLSGTKIQEFLQGSSIPGGEDKGIQFKLGDEKSDTKRHLAFWKSGDQLYARDLLSKRKEAFKLENGLKDALPWDRNHFVKIAAAPTPQASASPNH